MRQASFLLLVVLLATCLSCREATEKPETPLDDEEKEQFARPLIHACWQEEGSWPQFAHDPLHTGRVDADLHTTDLELAWTFRPGNFVRDYEPGYSVWSSPVVGTVNDRPLVVVGCNDHVVYALDAASGDTVWEFRPGAAVFASPALGKADGRPMVFLAAGNRSLYGLDAATGEKVWEYETLGWTYTVARSVMSSPALIQDGDIPTMVVGVWNGDRSSGHNVQQGELIVLNAATGKPRWRKRMGSVPLTSPAVARQGQDFIIYVGAVHGMVYAIRLSDAELLWTATLNEQSWSSPSLAPTAGAARVYVGSRLNSIFALDWRNGARRWRADAGYWIDATPAWFQSDDPKRGSPVTTVMAGSYDRSFYAWTPDRPDPLWRMTTGNYAYSTMAVARLDGEPVAFGMSWDQKLYMLDARTGHELWTAECGPLIWKHAWMGDSLWASPVVAMVDGEPTVFFPAYDGVFYAYRPKLRKGG